MQRDDLQQKDIENINTNIRRLEKAMEDGFDKVNTRLDIMNEHFIRKDLFDEKIRVMEEKISNLQDSNKWLYRTIFGTIITTIVGGMVGALFLIK